MGRFLMQVIKLWVVFWLCSKGKSVFVVLVVKIPVVLLAEKFEQEQQISEHTVKHFILRFI